MKRVLILAFALLLCVQGNENGEKDDKSDDFNPFDQGKDCPVLQCPAADSALVPLWPFTIESPGCTAQDVSGLDNADHNYYKHCCHIKNACYQICGNSKQHCDEEFERCMQDVCTAVGNASSREHYRQLTDIANRFRIIGALTIEQVEDLVDMSAEELAQAEDGCVRSMGIVKLMSNLPGCREYDAMQRRACGCIGQDMAKDLRQDVLTQFYTKYHPQGLDKVPALIEKAGDDVSTFAKLLKNLVAKHPAAIKKKNPMSENHRQEMMRKKMEKERKKNEKKKKLEAKQEEASQKDEL